MTPELEGVIRRHQPSMGGYGVLTCTGCRQPFSADHQIERMHAAVRDDFKGYQPWIY